MPPRRDLTKCPPFGRLTAKSRKEGRGRSVWHCVCQCGNKVDVAAEHLLSGNTRSCGCLKDEKSAARCRETALDLAGYRPPGAAIVCVRPLRRDRHGNWIWRCRCDCGNVCEGRANNIAAGKKLSCGRQCVYYGGWPLPAA